MLKITFEGNAKSVMFEMKALVNALSTNGKEIKEVFTPASESAVEAAPQIVEAVKPEEPKNWTTQDVQPEEPKAKVATAPAAPVAPVAPVKTYTLPEIQKALQPLMDEGRTAELVGLLQKFGVADLTKLPADQYPDFINDLRALGVRL